jgi:uncharacterized RDD family membrane protein YckC
MPLVGGSPAAAELRPAGLLLRVAAMVYEGVLLFGVAFAAGLALLALAGWEGPLAGARRLALQAALFGAIGLYFVWCWSRSGQTLALKTWKLRVIDAHGRPPTWLRALSRYLLAWHLFVPGLLAIAVLQPSRVAGLLALALGFVVLLLPAAIDPQRRLLHDRWSGTRIVRAD